jgi:hypothetical protein
VKKIFLLFGLITFATLLTRVNAQETDNSGNGRERIKALEIGYFTRQLNLSANEAERFWPLFNKYRQELKATVKNKDIHDELERQQKALDVRKKYRKDFCGILDEERGQKVYETEDNFRAMLRKEMQQRIKMRQDGIQPQNKHK